MRRPLTRKRVSVRVIILDRHGRVLMLEHAETKKFVLPGGGVELNEDVLELALIREVLEETKLRIIGDLIFEIGLLKKDGSFTYVFRAPDTQGQIQLNEESLRYAWVYPGLDLGVQPYIIHPDHWHYIQTICHGR